MSSKPTEINQMEENQYATDVQIMAPGQSVSIPNPVESTQTDPVATEIPLAPVVETPVPVEPAKVEITPKVVEPVSWESIDDKTRSSFIEKATNGQIKDLNNLTSLIKENEELKARPTEPQFSNEKQKSLYEFLSTYSGDDYLAGVQHYARLDAIDPKSLDFKSAIKEQLVIENLKIGIPAHVTEQNFEDEFLERFNEDDNRTPYKLEREGQLAKKFLASEKESIKTTLPVKNEVDTAKKEQEEKQYQEARSAYESQVRRSLHGDEGAFEALDFNFGDSPDEKVSFKIPDIKPIEDGLLNYQENFIDARYQEKDASGKVVYNTDKMRNDIAILNHFPEILAQTAEHFKKVGTLEAIKQRANITTPEQRQSVQTSTGGDSRYATDVVIHKR